MSGFVYKVRVNGETLIKKEIPGPDTVDEFLYEINALSQLSHSRNVIKFHGVILDEYGEVVKGLLISYAEQGALIDVIYDHDHGLSWPRREKWARQIVEGLSEVHEAGFVQGDFTLSNIVVDEHDNAKIIDINRRGCPVGWEPPEATPLIESSQRISMYIGVKSDLYQLGMVLWALAEQEDEPENHGRPLTLSQDLDVPDWFKAVVRICLADNPRHRVQAIDLLRLFPPRPDAEETDQPSITVDDGYMVQDYLVSEFPTGDGPIIKTVQAPSEWNHGDSYQHTYVDRDYTDAPSTQSSEPYYYPTRGRSPPSPMPSNMDYCEPRWAPQVPWTYPRERSFERRRSSSGFDFSHTALAQEDNDDSFAQRMRYSRDSEEMRIGEAVPGPTDAEDDLAVSVEGDAVDPNPEMKRTENAAATTSTMSQADEDISTQENAPDTAVHDADPPTAQQHEPGAGEPPEPAIIDPGDGEATVPQNHESEAPRSNGTDTGEHDFDPITTTTTPPPAQNPLFQEARITERDAPRQAPAALGPRAAKIQNPTSTSTVLDTKHSQVDQDSSSKIDSAIDMTTTTTPTTPIAITASAPDALGSHAADAAVAEARDDSASTIVQNDL